MVPSFLRMHSQVCHIVLLCICSVRTGVSDLFGLYRCSADNGAAQLLHFCSSDCRGLTAYTAHPLFCCSPSYFCRLTHDAVSGALWQQYSIMYCKYTIESLQQQILQSSIGHGLLFASHTQQHPRSHISCLIYINCIAVYIATRQFRISNIPAKQHVGNYHTVQHCCYACRRARRCAALMYCACQLHCTHSRSCVLLSLCMQ